jgi:hypothetical protein
MITALFAYLTVTFFAAVVADVTTSVAGARPFA